MLPKTQYQPTARPSNAPNSMAETIKNVTPKIITSAPTKPDAGPSELVAAVNRPTTTPMRPMMALIGPAAFPSANPSKKNALTNKTAPYNTSTAGTMSALLCVIGRRSVSPNPRGR